MNRYLYLLLFFVTLLNAQEFECVSKSEAERLGSEYFSGVHRQIAKISYVLGKEFEKFTNLKDLLNTLEPDNGFAERYNLTKDCDQNRCIAEQRNVTIDTLYILGFKYEDDRDYHLIVSNSSTEYSKLMNVEISGIPAQNNYYSISTLKKVRAKFKSFLTRDTYKQGSYTFFTKPIKAKLSGSLFFDVDHKAGVVGPKGFRPQSAWEIHPITDIDSWD